MENRQHSFPYNAAKEGENPPVLETEISRIGKRHRLRMYPGEKTSGCHGGETKKTPHRIALVKSGRNSREDAAARQYRGIYRRASPCFG